jgi:peptide/nickel transport system ATP-binding protein
MSEPTALIEARDVSRLFNVRVGRGQYGQLHAVDHMSLKVGHGVIIGLVGESGSGKTTIARMISLYYPLSSGELFIDGKPAPKDRDREAVEYRRRVQLMFQDPFGSLNSVHTVRYMLSRVLRANGFKGNGKALEARVLELLHLVRLEPAEDYLDKYPHEMSGGQRQRCVLARALAVNPKVILADEPISMLDVSIRAEMLNLLSDLRDTQGVSMLYVTHDIASARYLCDELVVMYAGQVVEQGPSEQVVTDPQHPYTKLLIESSPDPLRATETTREERFSETDLGEPPNVIDPRPGCRFAPRCKHAIDLCRTQDPPQVELNAQRWTRCWMYDPAWPDAATRQEVTR